MARREYSDADKATALAALDANEGNVYRTAKELSIPQSTLEGWAKGRGTNGSVSDLREDKKKALADELENIAYTLAGAIPGKVKDATLQQTATSLGIVVDKMQLLRGQPTNITDDASLSDEERAKRVGELLDLARARRDESAPGKAGQV